MAIGADFEIQADKDIRHVSGTDTYTVLELHRWLQDRADDATSTGDDNLDITDPDPSERATDNIISLINGFNIDDVAAQYFFGGSITQGPDGTNTVYSGLQVLGSVNSGTTELQVAQNNTILTNYWGTGINGGGNVLLRILVKSEVAGVETDGKRIRVQAREWGDSFDSFDVILGEGESVAAINTVGDSQNDTAIGTVAVYNVTNTEGFQLIDLLDGSGDQPYYSQWNYNAEGDLLKATYEYAKYIQVRDSTTDIHGLNGELFRGVTHSYDYTSEAGTAFVEDDIITWDDSTTQGTALLLALDTTGTKSHIQLLTGEAPTDGQTITNEATTGTHDLNGAPTSWPVPKVFLGSYTGSLIGAHGTGIVPAQLTASDSVEDLEGDTNTPPITVNWKLTGLIADSEVRLYKTSDDTEVDGVESSGTSWTYNYQYSGDIGVYQVVFHLSYKPIRLTGQTLTSSDQTIPIQQIPDRVYDNPA